MVKRILRWLSAIGFAVLAVPAVNADSLNHFTVLEDPTGVTYSVELQGVNYGTVHSPGQNSVGPGFWFSAEYFPLLYPESVSPNFGFVNGTNFVNWVEPDAPNTYNTLVISPSGNRGSLSFIMESDVPGLNWNVQSGDYNFNPCTDGTGSRIACPLLPNGASYEVPLLGIVNNAFTNVGSLTVTFADRGDTVFLPVPEPASCAMMLAGLALLGWSGRKRKLSAA